MGGTKRGDARWQYLRGAGADWHSSIDIRKLVVGRDIRLSRLLILADERSGRSIQQNILLVSLV
jgi:hypothetical protein